MNEATARRRGFIRVRATVNMSGMPAGRVAWVDPEDPMIAPRLKNRTLVPLSEPDGRPGRSGE